MWRREYTEGAKKDLSRLSKDISQRITDKIKFYTEQKNPLLFAKRLRFQGKEFYRFRIGAYRAVFEIDEKGALKILLILKVRHRKEVYR